MIIPDPGTRVEYPESATPVEVTQHLRHSVSRYPAFYLGHAAFSRSWNPTRNNYFVRERKLSAMKESDLGAPPKYNTMEPYSGRSTNYSELGSMDLDDIAPGFTLTDM